MFKKLKLKCRTDIYVDVMCVEMIIQEVTNIDRKLALIERKIGSLKQDKDAILFGNLLDLVRETEKRLKNFSNDSSYTGTSKYIEAATERLEAAKKDIQLILYGAKFE